MAIEAKRYFKERIKRIELALKELKQDIDSIEVNKTDYDFIRMLGDEKYRLQKAIEVCDTNKEISGLMNISERTVLRMRKKYKI